MRTAVIGFGSLFAILQIALVFAVQPNYRPDASARFIERSTTIPSMKEKTKDEGRLTDENLSAWIINPANEHQRLGYLTPIIFPLDLIYLVSLGCFLGSLSQLSADHVSRLSRWKPRLWWLSPVAYMICDLAEDSIILLTLSKTIALTPNIFALLRAATVAKLFTVTVANIQAVLLVGVWVASRLGLFEGQPA
jgi:hypothetical protein